MCGQIWGNFCPMQRKRQQNKNGLSRNQRSTIPDNGEKYSLLNQTMKNSSSLWKPLGESWKLRWQQQCRAEYRSREVVKPTAIFLGTQEKICLYCWCQRKHETKARRSWIQTPSRSHHCKRANSIPHYSFVRKFIPMPQAFENSRCKGSSGEKMGKTEEKPSVAADESQKQESSDRRSKRAEMFIFASLMDLCHLLNPELEPQYQKDRGRVVLRGDIVKDGSGSYAVFTEQGSSAFQMTAAKVMDK